MQEQRPYCLTLVLLALGTLLCALPLLARRFAHLDILAVAAVDGGGVTA